MLARIGGLEIRPFIPGYPQPTQPIQDSPYGLLGGALGISVFDANNQGARCLLGKKPVINGGPGPADVQISRGTGWETYADLVFVVHYYCLYGVFVPELSVLVALAVLNVAFGAST